MEFLHINAKKLGKKIFMMKSFGAILKELREQKGLNQEELAQKVGISRATLSDYERDKTEPNFSTLLEIAKEFGISTDELLGNLIAKDGSLKKREKGNVKGNLKGNLIATSQANEPQITGWNRMPKVVTVDTQGNDNVVMVPIRARAGYLAGYEDTEFIQSLPTYRLPGLSHGTYRMFEIYGQSMVPTYHESDIVISRFVENLLEIRDDRVYIVVTKRDGIVAKRVINRVQIEGKLILNSDNQRHPGEYPPIVINPEDILEIWYAVAFMSRQMRKPGEMYNRLIDVESRLTLMEDRFSKTGRKGE